MTSEDVRSQAKFDDTIGVFPEFIGTSIKNISINLIIPSPLN